VATVLATAAETSDLTLLLDSALSVDETECEFGFLFVPSEHGVSQLLDRLGLGG
jgi:hypothetical protein